MSQFNIDEDELDADWVKQSWDLPAIGTPEFEEFLNKSGMTMEELQNTPGYRNYIAKGNSKGERN